MTDLAILGLCHCGREHPVPVPDESECRTQEPFQRMICGKCSCPVEDLKIMSSVSLHAHRKTERPAIVT